MSQYIDRKTAELARAANMTVPQYRRYQLRLQGQMQQAHGAIAGFNILPWIFRGRASRRQAVKVPKGKLPQYTTPHLGLIKSLPFKNSVQSLLSSVMSPLAKKVEKGSRGGRRSSTGCRASTEDRNNFSSTTHQVEGQGESRAARFRGQWIGDHQ